MAGVDKFQSEFRKALEDDFNIPKALAITWDISGTYKNPQDSTNYGRKTEASGFSVIFYNKGIITGEWIGYSDLTWYKNLGYELTLPKRK